MIAARQLLSEKSKYVTTIILRSGWCSASELVGATDKSFFSQH